jgi:hypothetical protein
MTPGSDYHILAHQMESACAARFTPARATLTLPPRGYADTWGPRAITHSPALASFYGQ